MYEERGEEKDLHALETALTHRYNDSRVMEKEKEDWLHPQKRNWQYDEQKNNNN